MSNTASIGNLPGAAAVSLIDRPVMLTRSAFGRKAVETVNNGKGVEGIHIFRFVDTTEQNRPRVCIGIADRIMVCDVGVEVVFLVDR